VGGGWWVVGMVQTAISNQQSATSNQQPATSNQKRLVALALGACH